MYTQINGVWPEPTKEQFPVMSIKNKHYQGPWFEDVHWWWRHLPKYQKDIKFLETKSSHSKS